MSAEPVLSQENDNYIRDIVNTFHAHSPLLDSNLAQNVRLSISMTHCLYTPWSYATPYNVVTSLGDALRQRVFSHELVTFFNKHIVSCSHV